MLPDYIFMILFITEHVAWSPCIDNKCLFIIIIHLIITPWFYTIPLVLLCTLAQGVYVCTSYSLSLWSSWIHQPLSSDFCRCETFQTFMALLQTFLSKGSEILEVIWNSVWVKKKILVLWPHLLLWRPRSTWMRSHDCLVNTCSSIILQHWNTCQRQRCTPPLLSCRKKKDQNDAFKDSA